MINIFTLLKVHKIKFFLLQILCFAIISNFCFSRTITVVNLSNSGAGSLRQAISDAVAGDQINFAVTGTIKLSSMLIINKKLTITGPGANNLTISGNSVVRVLYLYNYAEVSIFGLTITEGRVNASNFGGGIYNFNANLTLAQCNVVKSYAGKGGGGIYSANAASTTIVNCTFSDNSCGTTNGAAIYSIGYLYISCSSIYDNTSSSSGGGLYLGSSGSRTIINSTISGNEASSNGGGICFAADFTGTFNLVNSTICNNQANLTGGGIFCPTGILNVNIKNSIIAGNNAAAMGTDISGTVNMNYSLIEKKLGATIIGSNNLENTNPKINSLNDNGGPTMTHSLDNTSPAINAAKSSDGPAYDQRMYQRNGQTDMGAYEVNGTPMSVTINSISSTSLCPGDAIQINFSVTGSFGSSNIFYAELSNSQGNFFNTYFIGQISGANGGTINAFIPANASEGNNYKIRIISTVPMIVGQPYGSTITVNPLPKVDIEGNKSTCSNNIEHYTCSTGNDDDFTFKWSATNGEIIDADFKPEVEVKWKDEGTGILKLVLTNKGGCKDSAAMNVTINGLPTPMISGKDTVCQSSIETYTIPPSSIKTSLSYYWIAYGGSINGAASGTSVDVIWGQGGTGRLVLIETINSTGCKDSAVKTILIVPLPVVSIIDEANEFCQGSVAHFRALQTSGVNCRWYVTGGNPVGSLTDSVLDVLWDGAGGGTIKLIQTTIEEGCKDSTQKNYIINPLPQIPSIIGLFQACEGSIENYYFTLSANIEPTWFCAGGTIQGANNGGSIDVLWDVAGTGSLKIILRNSITGCIDSTEKDIDIKPVPQPNLIGNKSVGTGSKEMYMTQYVDGNNYQWFVSGGTIDGPLNTNIAEVTWTNQESIGNVKVLETIATTGCNDTSSLEVTISELPKPSITGSFSVCEKNREVYSTSSNPDLELEWEVIGGAIFGSNDESIIEVLWADIGTGMIELHQRNKITTLEDSVIHDVDINPLPKVNILGANNACVNCTDIFMAKNPEGMSFNWEVTGGTIKGTSIGSSIMVNWGPGGIGKIKLTQRDTSSLCMDTASKSVNISEFPTPNFVGDTSVCEKTTSQYTTTSNPNISNKWTVQGGEVVGADDGNIVDVKWNHAGEGKLKLVQRIMSKGFIDSLIKTITINELPSPEITGPKVAAVNLKTKYTTSPDYDNLWRVTGGEILGDSIAPEIEVLWTGIGWDTIRLFQQHKQTKCYNIKVIDVEVSNVPKPSIRGNFEVCENSIEEYSAEIEYQLQNKWYVTGGIIEGIDTNHIINVKWDGIDKGTIKLVQTNSKVGYLDSTEQEVIIHSLPNSHILGDNAVVSNTDEIYTTSSPTNMKSHWELTGGTINGDKEVDTILVTWGDSGNGIIQVTQVDTLTNCTDSTVIDVTIYEASEPYISGSTLVCENRIENYNSSNNPELQREWNVVGGNIQGDNTQSSVAVLWGNPGTGSLKLVQTNTQSQITDSLENQTTINPLPATPSIILSGNFLISSSLSDNQWYHNDEILQGETGQAYQLVDSSGLYKVNVTDRNGCTSDMSQPFNADSVFQKPSSEIQFSMQGDTILEAKPGDTIHIELYLMKPDNLIRAGITGLRANFSFNATLLEPIDETAQGTIDTGNIRTIQIQTIIPESGNFLDDIHFRAHLGNDTSTVLKLTNITGIGGKVKIDDIIGRFRLKGVCMQGGYPRLISTEGQLSLVVASPNPSSESFDLIYELIEKGNTKLYLINTFGEKVTTIYDGLHNTGRFSSTISTDNLPSGTYFIILQTQTGCKAMKVEVVK